MLENLWVKIAAIVLAILLWFHVATDKVYQNSYTLPLKAVEITGDLVLTEPPPVDSITIMVSAQGKKLLRTDWKKRGLKLVASRSLPGKSTVDITTANLSLIKADEIELLEVLNPREISLICDQSSTRTLPIQNRINVIPDEGFMVDRGDSLNPVMVTVSGPKRMVDTLTHIATEAENFDAVRNNFTQKVALQYPDIYGLILNPDTVISYISVVPIKRRDFKNVRIRLINSPAGLPYEYNPTTIDIRLSGKAENLDTLQTSQISAVADYILIDSSGVIPIQMVLPPGISTVSKSSESVTLRFLK